MKTFSEMELRYRYLAKEFPGNIHFCQLHTTLVSYAPDLSGVIKVVRDHIRKMERDRDLYKDGERPDERIYASDCVSALMYDYEFIRLCDIATQYVTIEKNLHTGLRIELMPRARSVVSSINSLIFLSKREILARVLAWQIERGWDVPDPKKITSWSANYDAIFLTEDITYTDDSHQKIAHIGTTYYYEDFLTGDLVQDLLGYGYVDFRII